VPPVPLTGGSEFPCKQPPVRAPAALLGVQFLYTDRAITNQIIAADAHVAGKLFYEPQHILLFMPHQIILSRQHRRAEEVENNRLADGGIRALQRRIKCLIV
jgi:hypothetical protein